MDNILYQENGFALQRAVPADFNRAMDIIEQGRQYLKDQGIDQWQDGYPDAPCIRRDLEVGKGYFLRDQQEILGYMCIDIGGEPAYQALKGSWLTGSHENYLVIHRFALDARHRNRGLTSTLFQLAEGLCREKGLPSIRVDTDEDNQIMQKALASSGFAFCGSIWFDNSVKIAFEKVVG